MAGIETYFYDNAYKYVCKKSPCQLIQTGNADI